MTYQIPKQVHLDLDLLICYSKCKRSLKVRPFSGVICVEDSSTSYYMEYDEPFTNPPKWCPFVLEHLLSKQNG